VTLSLVVRCFNEEAHIGRLLTGVMRQRRRPDQIVIVDSGSTDATLAIASAFPVEIISIAPEEFSFGRALNRGIAATNTDVVALASAHVYPVYDSWTEHLVAPFADDSVALTYGRQLIPPDGRFSEKQLLARWFPPHSQPRQSDPFCNNANAAIRRAVWDEIRYDEHLTGLEDVAWAKRALDLGHALSYVAEAPVIHVHEETFRQTLNRYQREAIAHKQIYNDQEMSLLTALRLATVNILGDVRDARRQGDLRTHAADIPRFRLAQFLGTYNGFRQRGPVTEELKRRFYYPPDQDHHGAEVAAPGEPIDYDEPLRVP
jgi:glycosyltransferase involved in cell wall biosynthesis